MNCYHEGIFCFVTQSNVQKSEARFVIQTMPWKISISFLFPFLNAMSPDLHLQYEFTWLRPEYGRPTYVELTDELGRWCSSSCLSPRTLSWDLRWAMNTGNAPASTGPGPREAAREEEEEHIVRLHCAALGLCRGFEAWMMSYWKPLDWINTVKL